MKWAHARAGSFAAAAAFAVCLVAAGSARATPNFPGAIQTRLAATRAPDCSICHVCGVTGRGTVNTPWGAAMRQRGLLAYDESSLAVALAAMEKDRIDSDGDGAIDVDEVRMGKDPNPPTCDASGDDPTVPAYGCFGRIAGGGAGSAGGPALLLGALVVVAIVRRRRDARTMSAVLLVALGSATLTACASGAALAPRHAAPARPPAMPPIARSRLGDDVAALGLDPRHLPPFEALTHRQVRGLMSTFTRSMGLGCTGCHDRGDHRVRTTAMTITIHMWNEMTRPYAFEDGAGLYCDSCHQGQAKLLDRRDPQDVAIYMSESYTEQLRRVGAADAVVECKTCHGSPFDPRILARWLR